MKQVFSILLLAFSLYGTSYAQETFEFPKQREQALYDYHHNGQDTVISCFETKNGLPLTGDQVLALAGIMEQKSGYIRLHHSAAGQLTVTKAHFLSSEDILSLFRYAGLEMRLTSCVHTELQKR